jgi:LAS superfamily LD-carboxypeptidase LdcB
MKKSSLAVAAILCTTLAGAGYLVFFRPSAADDKPVAKTVKQQSQVKPAPVMVHLPGATPLKPLAEDYSDPASLWLVVSKQHPLANAGYVPANLALPSVKTRTDKSTAEQSLRRDIEPDIVALFTAANAAGHDILLASGYRSYEQQQIYFSNYSRLYGEESANKFSARPGQSEHQTGLSLDISLSSRQCYLEVCFGDTEAGKWLAAHAHEYGFILRYPADKTAITEYQYEPWHFRYVGRDLARALHESGLTLDEAYPYLQKALAELKGQGVVE